MAKRKARPRVSSVKRTKKRAAPKRSAKRPVRRAASKATRRSAPKKAVRRRAAAAKATSRSSGRRPAKSPAPRGATPRRKAASAKPAQKKTPRLDRARRTLDEMVPMPPSSLDLQRHGSAVRTGRAEMAETLADHAGMTPAITAGDVDVDVEDAYFTGDESPGGDNPTPDQDIVDDIGKALGVQYDDNEELKASDKISERDKHRWEMDPASSEDYKDRK